MSSIQEKAELLIAQFHSLQPKEKYEAIIDLGKRAPPLAPESRVKDNLVPGCQSLLYLRSYTVDGQLYFEAHSDALISQGLAFILTSVYSGHAPEVILKTPPDYIDQLGITASLSPTRANGLAAIFQRMMRECLMQIAHR